MQDFDPGVYRNVSYIVRQQEGKGMPRRLREDARQAALLGVTQAVRRYDGRGALVTFTAKRARGAVLDFLRTEDPLTRIERRKVKAGTEFGPIVLGLGVVARMGGPPAFSAAAFDVRRSLARLPRRDRRVLHLIYWEGWDQSEVARQMRLSRNYIWRLHRDAIARLRAESALPAAA